jgi:hypothetical protein
MARLGLLLLLLGATIILQARNSQQVHEGCVTC